MLVLISCVVHAAVGAESLQEQVLLPPRVQPHLLAHLVAVVDAESGDAVPFVEPRGPLHHLHLSVDLLKHPIDLRELEPVVDQARQPLAPQLGRVEVRHALYVAHECHVGYQRVYCPPEMNGRKNEDADRKVFHFSYTGYRSSSGAASEVYRPVKRHHS